MEILINETNEDLTELFEEYGAIDMPYINIPENILFWLEDGTVYVCTVQSSHKEDVNFMGYCSNEHYNGCLDFMIEQCITKNIKGWFLIEEATMSYSKGDGWTTDDDADFDFKNIRPASLYEMYVYGASWRDIFYQFKVYWKVLCLKKEI